jgi:hypothetical protein
MDIRYFALAEWVERNLVILERIHTAINPADHMTKILERTLFYRHVDYIMGRIPPKYSPCHESYAKQPHRGIPPDISIDDMVIDQYVMASAKCMMKTYPWVPIVARSTPGQSNLGTFPLWIVGVC